MNLLFTKLFDDTKKKDILFYVHWEITDSCNYQCPHCYLPKKQKYIDIEYAQNFIIELKNSNVFAVTLSGGEPLLHPHFSEIYVGLKKAGIIVDIITNASLINDSIVYLFRRYPPKILKISLYGTNNDNYKVTTAGGNFDRFDSNIQLLKKNNINFILQFSLTTLTYPFLKEYEDYCKKYEVSYNIGTMLRPMIDGNQENLSTRLPAQTIIDYNSSQQDQVLKWKNTIDEACDSNCLNCSAGKNYITIDSYGNISVCVPLRNPSFKLENPKMLSTLMEDIREFRLEMEETYSKSECASCELSALCNCCPAHSYLETGNSLKCVDYLREINQEKFKLISKNY